MKIYAVFDTNILVSAMISKSIAMFFTARNFTCPKHWLMGLSAILRSPFLVTGNTKHFPKTPMVVTPLEFLKKIGKI